MIDSPETRLLCDAAYRLAEIDPLMAMRQCARGMRRQTTGARLSAARQFVETLAAGDPSFRQQAIALLQKDDRRAA